MGLFKQTDEPVKGKLAGRRVAILATDGFEQSELEVPKKALEDAGADVKVVSPKDGSIRGWNNADWGSKVSVDLVLEVASADQFDALVLPGGVINPDKLRINDKAVEFVKAFAQSGKPIAAICHGPWTLINADAVKGRTLTSYASIKADLENAGAHWIDAPVVNDHGLVTSRKPDDLPAFCNKMIEEFVEGRHSPDRLKRHHAASLSLDPNIHH